ncbi:MAG: methionine--tRNA ligase [Patescibacteria group bacterium]
MKTRYFTASIPYVNSDPHIGHALELIQVDFLARYYRAKGDQVWSQFGTDDNSLKNVRAAALAGIGTEVFVKEKSAQFEALEQTLDLSFNGFMRTRASRHIIGAQAFWNQLDPTDLYLKDYEGLYCVGCEAFYGEGESQNGQCPTHHKALEIIKERNWFFRLSRYQSELHRLIEADELFIQPNIRKAEMLAFIGRGLEDFSLSRSTQRAEGWGVPVPSDSTQVMYVWVDALSNYLTALGFGAELPTETCSSENYETFWTKADQRVHVIGKDINRFHSIYWPAFLLSAHLPLPTEISVHGFLTLNGEKISKSLGNVIAPEELVARFGVEATKFIVLKALPLESDGDLSEHIFSANYSLLSNGVGNLVSRVQTMIAKSCEGKLRTDVEPWNSEAFKEELDSLVANRDFRRYLERVMQEVEACNKIIEDTAPFKLVKTDPHEAGRILTVLAHRICDIAIALAPVMPSTATQILERFQGDRIQIATPMFPREEEESLNGFPSIH